VVPDGVVVIIGLIETEDSIGEFNPSFVGTVDVATESTVVVDGTKKPSGSESFDRRAISTGVS